MKILAVSEGLAHEICPAAYLGILTNMFNTERTQADIEEANKYLILLKDMQKSLKNLLDLDNS